MHSICDIEVKGHKYQGQRSHWSRSNKDKGFDLTRQFLNQGQCLANRLQVDDIYNIKMSSEKFDIRRTFYSEMSSENF